MKRTVFTAAAAIVSIGIVAVIITGIFSMMSRDRKSSDFEVSNGNLVISGGSFGTTVLLVEMSDLKMTDTMPSITTKTNGAWIDNSCKGEFALENNVKARLYVNTGTPPFITFVQNNTVFYINADTPADTQSLYNLLK